LANDLWNLIPELRFDMDADRGRFLHNVAVFFGSPGAAADLARSRHCFTQALDAFSVPDEGGWHARILHNFASAISNLGNSPEELRESVGMFKQALAWRTTERAIARGVTLHNMGIVLRRLAELDSDEAASCLAASAEALREAAEIREAHRLAEGHALSLFHLGLTLEAAGHAEEAQAAFEAAANEFDRLEKADSAAIARARIPPAR
jgi:tetratricopeptide (TPR) repeat protein